MVCFVHSCPHHSPTSVVCFELEIGRQSLMSKNFLATDESKAPCGVSRDLTNHSWSDDEREVKGWILSCLIVTFTWRWLRREDMTQNKTKQNNFILALSGKEAFYGRWLSGNESACNAGDMGLIPIWDQEDLLGKEMATYSSILLAWEIP